ncbi:MAG: HNH endonuclease [Pseudomonadota bacterium]|nr:HNH endonuclease [Pseudomonadota bacterium]
MSVRILRLNLAGQPVEWVSWQEAVCLHARDLVRWNLGSIVLTVRGGWSRQTQTRSSVSLHSIIACEGKIFTGGRQHPPLTNSGLFRRDRRTCLYCGASYSERLLTRDHVVPKSKGGRDTWTNVVTACRRCNQKKGDRLLEKSGMELLALPYRPNWAEYLALENSGRVLGDQMEFLRGQFTPHYRAA